MHAARSLRDAFDRHAINYDVRFSHTPAGTAMREEVWQTIAPAIPVSGRLLDVGCGTGEDALHFAAQGIHVTAIDISSRMIETLRDKARAAGLVDRIDARVGDLQSTLPETSRFDTVFSNFGAVNCIADPDLLRKLGERSLISGGRLILVSMGRFYPLETALFLAKGNLRLATRRFAGQQEATVESVTFPVWFHSPKTFDRTLGAHFTLEMRRGLRALLPVPGFEHVGTYLQNPLVHRLDAALTRWPPTASWADHFLSIWRHQ